MKLAPPRARRRLRLTRSVAAGLAALAVGAHADDVPERSDLPLWEFGLGAGGISQLAYPGADEQVGRVAVLPYVVYRGRVLRADSDGAGLRTVRTERFELDVSLAGSLSAGDDELQAREGMARLRTLVEVGPVARWYLNGRDAAHRVTFELPLRGVFELRDLSRHRGMVLEPELGLDRRVLGGWNYGLSAGAVIGDERLASTLYAVSATEARPDRPAYDAREGLVAWRLGGRVFRQLTPDLRLFAFGRLESVAGAANRDSPLVRRSAGASAGVGLVYTLGRSAARGVD